ncbi:hypothetical protein [Microbulbifer sp. A4B17]|uniref:hypothetical protein n=1 Tax=Microbulbifer sp. A4B17 TaxID=359370 RepID=UPI0013008764|nr:hypothetical protein [Microbulbifer sp. A4B17]
MNGKNFILKSAVSALLLLALSACGGGGGGSSSSSNSGGGSGGSESKTFSSSITAVNISRKDSGDSLPVSGLPSEGAEITLSK